MTCPICGAEAYVGLSTVQCPTLGCSNGPSVPPEFERPARPEFRSVIRTLIELYKAGYVTNAYVAQRLKVYCADDDDKAQASAL